MPTEDTWRPPNAWCQGTHFWHANDDQATEDEVIELVAAFVRALQPEVVVECGTWTGSATVMMGEALLKNGHGHLHAVEIDVNMAERAQRACLGLPVTVIHGSSTAWTPPEGIGFAWVDGATDRVAELDYLLPHMLPGAIIGVHDTGPLHVSGRMDQLNAHPRLRVITLRTPRGVSFAEVLDPGDSNLSAVSRGEAFRSQGRPGEALADFTSVIERKPDAWTLTSRGDTYRLLGRHEEALADFTRALEISPSSWTLTCRGDAYRLLGRNEEALADLTRAIELNPRNDWAHSSRGEVYRLLGRHEEALADLSRAIELRS